MVLDNYAFAEFHSVRRVGKFGVIRVNGVRIVIGNDKGVREHFVEFIVFSEAFRDAL